MVPIERIQQAIFLIRGEKVMLDADLAGLYGVETKALNRAVRRNAERFPVRFMFQLTSKEFTALRCQLGASRSHGGRRYPPYAFTEYGAVMLATVLNSAAAIRMSVQVVEAFVRLRKMIASNEVLARKVTELEGKLRRHDQAIAVLFDEIRTLLAPPPAKAQDRIGFRGSR
jgi:hypothetical protein